MQEYVQRALVKGFFSAVKSPKTGRRSGHRKRTQPNLARGQILETALRLVDQHGLEGLSFRSIARELGVTPAAVHWHVRSKDELLGAIINAVFKDFTAIPGTTGPWAKQVRDLYTWLRGKLLANAKILGAPALQGVLPYALTQVGLAGRRILEQAGLEGDELMNTNRTLFSFTSGFMIHEALLFDAFSPSTTPKFALDHAIETLPREDLASVVANLPRMLDFDVNQLFEYTLDRLLEGIQDQLNRRL